MSYLLAKDTLNGAEGKIFITVNGRNIEVACMKNIQTNAEKSRIKQTAQSLQAQAIFTMVQTYLLIWCLNTSTTVL